jgi:tRNA nucleotidyltransferase (CCA-adding enzyme)
MAPTDRPDMPADAGAAAIRLSAATVPAEILEVAQCLQDRGHAAVLVGGAVRDVLLGLPADDWDLATSARPEEVQAAFRRTIPTGIEHGTVTVLVRGRGGKSREGHEAHVPVEVTTFRGEGAYIDGRRPSAITFLRDLVEDLARRDFTVNAFAWDPIARRFDDPFDGLADLRAGVLRAVGEPARRFGEETQYDNISTKGDHDHLICTGCGHIVEFEDPAIEGLRQQVALANGFHLTGRNLELYGLCAGCRSYPVPPAMA